MKPTALIMIDWQIAFDDHAYWGGNRNNPHAENNAQNLLEHWRSQSAPIIHCIHNSQDPNSPLRQEKTSGQIKSDFIPLDKEVLMF